MNCCVIDLPHSNNLIQKLSIKEDSLPVHVDIYCDEFVNSSNSCLQLG